MDRKYTSDSAIELDSLVNSHDKPFVVIDSQYHVIAANRAYESKYHVNGEQVIGKMCYQVSHGKNHPCNLDGEECPHQHVFSSGKAKVCAHIHYDANHHTHQVKVSAFPITTTSHELLLGECIEEIKTHNCCAPVVNRMVGESGKFRECLDHLNIASGSDVPVLLHGETGTGKELAAEYIHQHSARCHKVFQIIDSTIFSDNLFESEMFGHVNGAFTGCTGEKQGLFEIADGGTIFLDEIGDLPLLQQAKLLRVLESGEYRRVGGKKNRQVNVRVVCASNRNLWEMVSSGQFREDLYYRIACLNIRLPALRERIDDVPILSQALLDSINHSMHSQYYLSREVFDRLKCYSYPGNIRELRNILFIATTRCQGDEIDMALIESVLRDLPQHNELSKTACETTCTELETVHDEIVPDNREGFSLKEIERQHIQKLLEQFQGNRKLVAEALGVSVRTMYRKLKSLNIH